MKGSIRKWWYGESVNDSDDVAAPYKTDAPLDELFINNPDVEQGLAPRISKNRSSLSLRRLFRAKFEEQPVSEPKTEDKGHEEVNSLEFARDDSFIQECIREGQRLKYREEHPESDDSPEHTEHTVDGTDRFPQEPQLPAPEFERIDVYAWSTAKIMRRNLYQHVFNPPVIEKTPLKFVWYLWDDAYVASGGTSKKHHRISRDDKTGPITNVSRFKEVMDTISFKIDANTEGRFHIFRMGLRPSMRSSAFKEGGVLTFKISVKEKAKGWIGFFECFMSDRMTHPRTAYGPAMGFTWDSRPHKSYVLVDVWFTHNSIGNPVGSGDMVGWALKALMRTAPQLRDPRFLASDNKYSSGIIVHHTNLDSVLQNK